MLITTTLLNSGDINEAIAKRKANPHMGWLLDIISNGQPNHALPAPAGNQNAPGNVQRIGPGDADTARDR